MCIAIYKPAGKAMLSEATLRECFYSNPDGAGFAYIKNRKVEIVKGFMDFKSFYDNLYHYRNYHNDAMLLHFRISTQGGVTPNLCHPYRLDTDKDKMMKLKDTCDTAVIHNGIISITSNSREKVYNDTQEFISKYLTYFKVKKNKLSEKEKLIISHLIGSSKLAIMDAEKTQLIGDWICDNGIYYSNKSYMPARFGYGMYGLSRTSTTYKQSSHLPLKIYDDWGEEPEWEDDFIAEEKDEKDYYDDEEYEIDLTDEWEVYYRRSTDSYEFPEGNCPQICDLDDSYCSFCSRASCCPVTSYLLENGMIENEEYFTQGRKK